MGNRRIFEGLNSVRSSPAHVRSQLHRRFLTAVPWTRLRTKSDTLCTGSARPYVTPSQGLLDGLSPASSTACHLPLSFYGPSATCGLDRPSDSVMTAAPDPQLASPRSSASQVIQATRTGHGMRLSCAQSAPEARDPSRSGKQHGP